MAARAVARTPTRTAGRADSPGMTWAPRGRAEPASDRLNRITAPSDDRSTAHAFGTVSVDDDSFDKAVKGAGDSREREANAMSDAVIAGRRLSTEAPAEDAGSIAQRAGRAPGDGRPLEPAARNWFEPRFGRDLSHVRIHDSGAADGLSRQAGARAFAVGPDVYFRRGEYAPFSDPGRSLVAHEIAHTLQPSGRAAIARKTLTAIPATTRAKLKIARTAPPESTITKWVADYFDPKSRTSATRASLTTEFGAEITDAQHQKGLRNVAIELVGISEVEVTAATATEPEQRTNTNPEDWPLPPDGILDLALDLRPLNGEHAVFRFIRYTNARADTVLIEKTRVLAPPPAPAGTNAPPAPAPAPSGTAPSFTGDVHVSGTTIKIGTSFGNDRGKIIADAVGLLPTPIRAKVDGVSFELAGSGQGPGGQNGEYVAARDVVRVWGDLFAPSARRVGDATNTAYQVVHELGHAIDLRPRFKAQRDRDQAEARRKQLEGEMKGVEGKFRNPNDPMGETVDLSKDPRVVEEKKRIQGNIDSVNKDIQTHTQAIASAKSIAGSELGGDTESLLTDFGKALAADGVSAVTKARKRNRAVDAANKAAQKANEADPTGPQKPMQEHEKTLTGSGVSLYSMTDLMEAFAENFSYYTLDEALLKAIRPKTFDFFAKEFPKAPPAPKP